MASDMPSSSAFLRVEVCAIFRRALPLIVQAGCIQAQTIWGAAIAGPRIGPAALGAVVMGSILGNLMLRSVITGGLSGFDALGANAFGSQAFAEVGVLAQRAAMLCFACFPLVYVLWFCIEPLLLFMGQPADVVPLVGVYLRGTMLGFPAILLNQVLNKFLVVQCVPLDGLTLITAVTNLGVHPFLMVWMLSAIGFAGVPWSTSIVDWLRFTWCLLHVKCSKLYHPETWQGWQLRAALSRNDIVAYCRLALPGILGMNESWYWEFVSMFVGQLGTTELSAHAVGYSFTPWIMGGLPGGFGNALGARVGAILSEGRAAEASLLAKVGVGAGAIMQVLLGISVFLARDVILEQYTQSASTIRLCRKIWPQLSIAAFSGGFFNVQAALLRSLGMHSRLAWVTFISLWIVTLPAVYLVGLHWETGLVGIWSVHVSCRLLLMNPALLAAWCCLSWKEQGEWLKRLREMGKAKFGTARPETYGRVQEADEEAVEDAEPIEENTSMGTDHSEVVLKHGSELGDLD